MKDDQTAQGFSFQLSASAPPAEVSEAPHDSGPSWFRDDGERLDLDLDAFAMSAPAPAAAPAADDVTRTPAPVDATSPPPPVAKSEAAAAAPAVRRIQFPSRSASPSKPAATSRPQKTVFSSSVSQAPRARLISDDVESDVEPPVEAPRPSIAPKREAPRPAEKSAAKQPPIAARTDALAATRERMIELARAGSALTERSARLVGTRGASFARKAGAHGVALFRLTQEKLARARRNADESAERVEPETTEARQTSGESDTQSASTDAKPPQAARKSPAQKPWVSGAAAMVAAVGCYLGASHVVGMASPAPQAAAERSEAQSAPEGEEPGAEPGQAASEGPGEAPAGVALSKGVPASAAPPSEDDGDDQDAPETAPPGPQAAAKADSSAAPALEQLSMPEGLSWPKKGLIEVVTGGRELVYVDGVFTGRGPLRRIPISPGSHEVVVRTEGKERKMRLDVTVGKRARLVFGG